jgi:hypothetical protein
MCAVHRNFIAAKSVDVRASSRDVVVVAGVGPGAQKRNRTMKKLSKKTAAKPAKGAKVTKASKAKAAAIRASLAKPTNGAKPAKASGPRKESKLAICAALLTRKEGCTTRDLLTACAWPAISVPATAKAAGLKLRKEKTKGSPTVYFGSAT